MPKGGKRAGAGRPKGAPNRKTREVVEKAAAEGLLPLDYMLQVMRDADVDKKRRDFMAQAAAPYLHPKLSSIQHGGDPDSPVKHEHGLSPALQAAIDKIIGVSN